VVEAEKLCDEVGIDSLSLAALAGRLGVRQPSLYKHVDGLPALKRAIAVRGKVELGQVLARAGVGRAGDDAVRALAAAYRTWADQHPGRYHASVRAADPSDPEDQAATAAAVAVVLDVLAGYGVTGADAVHAARALRSAMHGFVSLEAAGGFGLPESLDESYDRLVEGCLAMLGSPGRTAEPASVDGAGPGET
jgi:AcrR family transcriptional regulator